MNEVPGKQASECVVPRDAAIGSSEDLDEAAALVGRVLAAKTNGDALGAILAYRFSVRSKLLSAAPQPSPQDDRQDAERYRWLRKQKHIDIAACWFIDGEWPEGAQAAMPEQLDAAIDAAIKSTPPRQE